MKFTLISNIFEPHVRGGYELGCATIGQRLQSLGHEVAVLTSPSPGVLEKTAATSGLLVHRLFEPVFEYEEHLCGVFARSGLWQLFHPAHIKTRVPVAIPAAVSKKRVVVNI